MAKIQEYTTNASIEDEDSLLTYDPAGIGATKRTTFSKIYSWITSKLIALNKQTALASTDQMMMVKGGNVPSLIDYNTVAKALLEEYAGTSLNGDLQSVKTAVDALGSNLQKVVSYLQNNTEDFSPEYRALTNEELDDIADRVLDEMTKQALQTINARGQEIAQITTNAESLAADAVSTANSAINQVAALDSQVQDLVSQMADVSIDPDDLGLEQDPDTYYVYPTYKGVRSENGIPLSASGGGGGGSGELINAVLTVENTSGFLSKTIPSDSSCIVSFVWSSIENEMSTGDGTVRITVNEIVRATRQIAQGSISLDLKPYLSAGINKVKVRISDTYDQGKTTTFNITSIAFSLSSSFDTTSPYNTAFSFPFTPVSSVSIPKTVYVEIDGNVIGTEETQVSGRQMSMTIPAQTHGSHTLRCYFQATIDGEVVRSNVLYYEFLFVEQLNNKVIIASSFDSSVHQNQYSSVVIPYTVYNPTSMTSEVKLYVNGVLVSTQTVDRTEQSYTYRADRAGTVTFKIVSGATEKEMSFVIDASDVTITPETDDLALYLSAQGRSNNEETWNVWKHNDIAATFTDFTRRLDGWQSDEDGITVLRVSDDARVTIPYNVFATDCKSTGKTIEIEFATRDVTDYSAVIMSCISGGIGFRVTPQSVYISGAQTNIQTLYKENEHIRVSLVIEKQTDWRLILVYINGVMSGSIQYASGERFSQLSPAGITIGSNDCTIDIYNIRVYNNNLNRRQIVNNWIADTQVGDLMIERYDHNNVYDGAGNITINTLPSDLPYFIFSGGEGLPTYKGDKETVNVTFVDPLHPSKSFTATGVEIDVQGTSSAIYYFKNLDSKYKQGFELATGHADDYGIRSNSIPFNRFVLKADVASSESANNTVLSMFYSDTDPYLTPEQQANPKVRKGIEGIPVVMFWNDTVTGTTVFQGKYNFNLPKRAAAPYGYSGNDESWEFERNNSGNAKFQDDDFTSESWDETEQTWYPTWYDDWEARFPSDEWRDYSKLKEFVSWVKSTDRSQATNETLASPVTYTFSSTATVNAYPDDTSYTVTDGSGGSKVITFTKDTPAYRLSKFKAEAPNYMEMQSLYYYYLFTLLFLMIDSRAKNMFIGFHGSPTSGLQYMDRKVVFEPYDMDTALGTNNSGVLMFTYSLLDTDVVSSVISGSGGSDAPVFNAQDSVLFLNTKDACRAEWVAMYRELRAGSYWNYNYITKLFTDHQSKWPEAIYNEDAYQKYLVPLIEPVTVDEDTGNLIRTDRYLTMLQGSKDQQRKWWLFNRFKYLDSMTSTGDAANKTINLRLFAAGTMNITPAIDLFVGVRFGGGTTPDVKRTTANKAVSFSYIPSTGVTEMETWILSADQIKDVGDLSPFYPNELDFSMATKLQHLKVGSNANGYFNTNLRTINVRNCGLLEDIDCRNCPNLNINVDLESSPRLKEAYFDGTSITGVNLADGCSIEKLHLPATITQLTLINLSKLTELVVPSYANVSRLMISNMNPSVVDISTILNAIPANTQVSIIGFEDTFTSYEDICDFYDLLDTMQGVSREKNLNGEWIYHDYDTAQVSGTIHIGSLTGAQIAALNARYPYITVDATHTTSYRTYKTWDGSEVLATVTCTDGVPQQSAPTIPARTSTAQYTFTQIGWSTSKDSSVADFNVNSNTKMDVTVYAAYSRTVRQYTVTWKDYYTGNLETETYNYGDTPRYKHSMPTHDGETAHGWTPEITTVTGSITYTSTYKPVWTVTFKSQDGSTTLSTASVVDGNNATYSGETPTNADNTTFLGWAASANMTVADASILNNITANKTVFAAFESAVEDVEIEDTWDQIIATVENGTYKTKYKIGNYKPLDLGTEGTIDMQIVAFDADDKADGSGKAKVSVIAKNLLATKHKMNGTPTTEGGWAASAMRKYLTTDIASKIPAAVSSRIVQVSKTYKDYTNGEQTSSDSLWIPSNNEVTGDTTYETTGPVYTALFKDKASRIKTLNGSAKSWWLRSANHSTNFRSVGSDGRLNNNSASNSFGVALGFCLD